MHIVNISETNPQILGKSTSSRHPHLLHVHRLAAELLLDYRYTYLTKNNFVGVQGSLLLNTHKALKLSCLAAHSVRRA